jgi:hypothetical protein
MEGMAFIAKTGGVASTIALRSFWASMLTVKNRPSKRLHMTSDLCQELELNR